MKEPSTVHLRKHDTAIRPTFEIGYYRTYCGVAVGSLAGNSAESVKLTNCQACLVAKVKEEVTS